MTVLVEETTATAAAAAVTKEQRAIVFCWILFAVGVMCAVGIKYQSQSHWVSLLVLGEVQRLPLAI